MGGRGGSSASAKAQRKATPTVGERAQARAEAEVAKYADSYFDSLEMRVPEFVLDKLNSREYYAVTATGGPFTVKRETEKAALLEVSTDYGNVTVWSPKSVIKTREEARAATAKEMARQFVNDDYYAYLRTTAKAGGVKLGSVKKWSKIKQKMDLAGVKYLDKSEYINTRE